MISLCTLWGAGASYFLDVAHESNTFPFFIGAGILSVTGIYFYVSGMAPGAIVMEVAAALFLALGMALTRHYRRAK